MKGCDEVVKAQPVGRDFQHCHHVLLDAHTLFADQRRDVQRTLEEGGADAEGFLRFETPVGDGRHRLHFQWFELGPRPLGQPQKRQTDERKTTQNDVKTPRSPVRS